MAEVTQETVDRVGRKLQEFHDSLSEDEQIVLEALVSKAKAEPEVAGHMMAGMPMYQMRVPAAMMPERMMQMPMLGVMVK